MPLLYPCENFIATKTGNTITISLQLPVPEDWVGFFLRR